MENTNNKIDFINKKLNGIEAQIPHLLYKYRPFDEYTFDMLENSYLYLCPAKNLDDKSECTVSFNIQDYADIDTCLLNFKCVDLIVDMVKQHASEGDFSNVQDIIHTLLTPNGYIRRDWLLQASFELERFLPREDCVNLVNWLGNISEMLDSPTIKPQIEKLFSAAYDAREKMGICSLTPIKDEPQMWDDYAKNREGYCIEYDMTGYKHIDLIFPVVYQDIRQNNILITILYDFIAQAIFGISSGKLTVDRTNYIRMFLTKETKWDYQKEWRILGDGNTRIEAPTIKTIYLGKNISDNNRQIMLKYCKERGIDCIEIQ